MRGIGVLILGPANVEHASCQEDCLEGRLMRASDLSLAFRYTRHDGRHDIHGSTGQECDQIHIEIQTFPRFFSRQRTDESIDQPLMISSGSQGGSHSSVWMIGRSVSRWFERQEIVLHIGRKVDGVFAVVMGWKRRKRSKRSATCLTLLRARM